MSPPPVFSPRLIAALASVWGVLVWANWLKFNPVEPVKIVRALAAYGRVELGPAVGAIAGHALLAILVGILALSAFGAGISVLAFARGDEARRRGAVSLLLGAGAVSFVCLGAGLCGLAFPSLAWVVVGPVALFGAVKIVPGVARFLSAWREKLGACSPWWLSVAVALGLLIALSGALVPASAYDAIFHHLAHPAIYAQRHRIVLLPHHFLSYYPAGIEMQYLAAFLLGGGAGAAKLVHFCWGLFTIGVLVAWARMSVGGNWALAAAAGLILIPYVQLTMMWGYVDLGTAACVTVALWALAAPPVSPFVLGALAGIAAGTKASGVFVACLAAAVLVARRKRRNCWLAFGLTFLVVALPWGARNWLASGNPVAPFLAGTIPTLNFGADNLARYQAELTSYQRPGAGGILSLLASPWTASVRNLGVLDQGGGMSGWFLFALPLLLLLPGAGGRLPAFLCGGYFLLWLALPRQVRYLLPVWPAAALACVHALRALSRRGGLALVPVGLAALMLGLHLLAAFQRQRYAVDPLRVALGSETAEQYLERGIGGKPYSVRARKWVRDNLAGERFLVVSDFGLGMLWGRGAVFQSAFDTPLIERFAREGATPAAIAGKFRQMGIRRVVYGAEGGFPMQEEYGIYGFDPGSAKRWREYWVGHARLIYSQNDRYHVYSLDDRVKGDGRTSVLPGLDEQLLAGVDGKLRRTRERGDPEGAFDELAREYDRIAHDEESPAAYERLGILLVRMNRGAEARRAFSRAAACGRDSARLEYARGLLEFREAEFASAIRRLRSSLRRDPDQEDAHRLLAHILLKLGRRAEAAAVIQEGLERNPGNEELAQMLADAARRGR